MKYSIINLDARYTITKEYCGKANIQFVIRYCGEFVSSHDNKEAAIEAARKHNEERIK